MKLTESQIEQIRRLIWTFDPMGTATLDDLREALNDLGENGRPPVRPEPDAYLATRGILKECL